MFNSQNVWFQMMPSPRHLTLGLWHTRLLWPLCLRHRSQNMPSASERASITPRSPRPFHWGLGLLNPNKLKLLKKTMSCNKYQQILADRRNTQIYRVGHRKFQNIVFDSCPHHPNHPAPALRAQHFFELKVCSIVATPDHRPHLGRKMLEKTYAKAIGRRTN